MDSLGSQGPRGGHIPQQLLRLCSETNPAAAPDLHPFTGSAAPGRFLLEASELPGQALFWGDYVFLTPLSTADPSRSGAADPSRGHSSPSSLCCSSPSSAWSLGPASAFISASAAASQHGVTPCVSYRGPAGFGLQVSDLCCNSTCAL